MSENSNTQPPKGILKHTARQGHKNTPNFEDPRLSVASPRPNPQHVGSNSKECPNSSKSCSKNFHTGGKLHFDEENIKATFHPDEKDYGYDKIEEAKTPYHQYQEPEDESNSKCVRRSSIEMSSEDNSLDPKLLTQLLLDPSKSKLPDDEISNGKPSDFKTQRKLHYNEFKEVQIARELIEKDPDEINHVDVEATTDKKSEVRKK